MTLYRITLLVTAAQEEAIIILFNERCWEFVKIGKRQANHILTFLRIVEIDSYTVGSLTSDASAVKMKFCYLIVMPPTLKKLMEQIAFGACVGACITLFVPTVTFKPLKLES